MWRQMAVLVVTTMVATEKFNEFNPNDESDYIDDVAEDEPSSTSVWVSDIDIVSTKGSTTKGIQAEVEKLLGQPVFHYEEPSTIVIPSESERPSSTSRRPPAVTSTSQSSTKSDTRWVKLRGAGLTPRVLQFRPRGHRTSDVVYSVRVPQWDDNYPQVGQKIRPGVIESLVNAHDIVRFETPRKPTDLPGHPYHPSRTHGAPTRSDPVRLDPTRTSGPENRTAFNEGGFRYKATQANEDNSNVLAVVPTGRRYLVTRPGAHFTTKTRRPRPTPVTHAMTTIYQYTRRTRRHPNCTDSYYECLFMCFDRKGYRVNCPWDTRPPRPEPNRLNFTGLFHAVHKWYWMTDYDVSNLFWSWKDQLIAGGYRSCRTFTSPSTTTRKIYPIYYDDVLSPKTGRIIAKCWVCGLNDYGIPLNSHCADNFGNSGNGIALSEKNSYRRYCRFMDEVPLWFNRSDPFSVWGQWTGGCSYRWLDLTGLYTQRACRSKIVPAMGHHFLSKRMARLELALADVREGCVVSPMATLVPFSRAISLYARFHVCVCRGHFCNQASHKEPSWGPLLFFAVCARTSVVVIF